MWIKPHGWELQIPVGSRTRTETLVAVGSQTNLSTALAEATISAVHFDATTYAQGDTGKVVVVYNEQVDVTNGATLVVGVHRWFRCNCNCKCSRWEEQNRVLIYSSFKNMYTIHQCSKYQWNYVDDVGGATIDKAINKVDDYY